MISTYLQKQVKPTAVKNVQLSKGQKRKNSQRFEKGIISSTRPQNLTNHGGWRPKPINFRKMDPSKQLLVNGCQLTLRQCRSFVMFEIETFTGTYGTYSGGNRLESYRKCTVRIRKKGIVNK